LKKDKSSELWERFRRSLEPLEDKIDFWLFQMPPNYKYKQENIAAIKDFFEGINLGNKAVVEFRAFVVEDYKANSTYRSSLLLR
jgi:uncharacterized protein YecE (DUF72 family)